MITTGLAAAVLDMSNTREKYVNEENPNRSTPILSFWGFVWQILNLFIGMYALYLAFRCTRKRSMSSMILHLLVACCCGPCYIAYAIAVNCQK